MNDKVLGYILNESFVNEHELRNVQQVSKNVVRMEAVLQDADVENRNKRVYPKSILSEGLKAERLNEKLRTNSLLSEMGHPDTQSIARQSDIVMTNAAAVIKSVYWDPKDPSLLIGLVESAGTSVGKDFAGLIIENDMQASFSLRALGKVENKGGRAVVTGPLQIITWDVVNFPSHKKAYSRQLVNEFNNCDRQIPVTESVINNYIKDKSSNVQMFNEQVLQIASDAFGIKYIPEEGRVVISENGVNRGTVLLESKLQNELYSSMSSLFKL